MNSLPQIGQIDPNDIANGFYTHVRRVGPANPEFLDIVSWLILKGSPKDVILVSEANTTPDNSPRWMPSILRFYEPLAVAALKNDNTERKFYNLDASMAFNYPENALIGLKVFFGFGDPNVREYYPGLRQPVQFIEASPIGFAWPEMTKEYGRLSFHGSAADNGNTYPENTIYTDVSGSYRKISRKWAFINIESVWVKV